jgi:hypothetical protein
VRDERAAKQGQKSEGEQQAEGFGVRGTVHWRPPGLNK